MKKILTAAAATLIATSAIAAPVGGSYQADGGWTGYAVTDHVTRTNLTACMNVQGDNAPMLTSGADALTDQVNNAVALCNTQLDEVAVQGR